MNLNLTRYDVNLILQALGKMPYEDVAPVIQSIVEQVEAQEAESA